MAAQSIPQPSAQTFTVEDLVKQVRGGRVRIPRFQRPLRWGWEDCRRLFDSILKGYPIGSLLLWKRPADAEHVSIGAVGVDAPALAEGWWVVDGQQRLTSLASALSDEGQADPRFALGLDVRKGELVKPSDEATPHVIPLPVLFDLQRLLRWLAAHPEMQEFTDDASAATKAIREFRIPAYVVEQQDETVLREIFDRMNSAGKRLSRAEVFAALHPSAAPDAPFERITDDVDRDLRFGRLDDDTVLRVVLARRGGDVTRQIREEFGEEARKSRDFGEESEADAYREGQRALEQTVKFLQHDAGVPHIALLPYRYLLVVLSRFFAHFPDPTPRNRTLLRRWYWRAALIGPQVFDGWTNAMRVLGKEIAGGQEDASVQRLLARTQHSWAKPNLERFRTNQADTRIALCALWERTPRSPRTGEPYTEAALADAIGQATTPRDALAWYFRALPHERSAWAANRFFLIEDEPTESPADLFSRDFANSRGLVDQWQAILESHGMNEILAECLAKKDEGGFLDGRQALISEIVASFIARKAEFDFEDTPPLASLDEDDGEEEDDDAAAGPAS